MATFLSDEAIILKTYDVGEADRFCVLLTKHSGKIVARAHGVRRLLSRRGMHLLSLKRVLVNLTAHSAGYVITQVSDAGSPASPAGRLHSFAAAEQGIELLLHFLDEGSESGEVFSLACDFLASCAVEHSPALLFAFTLKLLRLLGLLPALDRSSVSGRLFAADDAVVFSAKIGGLCLQREDQSGDLLGSSLRRFLAALPQRSVTALPSLDEHGMKELKRLTQCALGSQLGAELKVPPVAARMSSLATPIW